MKLGKIQEQLQTAQQLLTATDWLFIRANEMSRGVDVAIPTAVITGRDEVRSVCDANCDLIVAAEDVPGLEALMKAPAQILEDAEDPNSGLMPNPEPHLEPYPMMDPQEFLDSELLAPKPATTPKARRK